ncbi:hypothetical protein GCM10007386_50160 [Pseudoduganella dura]|nr:hypothetical protein GCM10007386_50160 [Pseudoduganella dura]
MDQHRDEPPVSTPDGEDDGNPKFGRLLAVLLLALVLVVLITFASEALFT